MGDGLLDDEKHAGDGRHERRRHARARADGHKLPQESRVVAHVGERAGNRGGQKAGEAGEDEEDLLADARAHVDDGPLGPAKEAARQRHRRADELAADDRLTSEAAQLAAIQVGEQEGHARSLGVDTAELDARVRDEAERAHGRRIRQPCREHAVGVARGGQQRLPLRTYEVDEDCHQADEHSCDEADADHGKSDDDGLPRAANDHPRLGFALLPALVDRRHEEHRVD